MFNVTIIKFKDIVKIITILIIVYIISRFFAKNISIKNYLEQTVISFNTSDFVKFGINTESNIIKKVSEAEIEEKTEEDEESINEISVETIIQIASNIFTAEETEKNEDSQNLVNTEESLTEAETGAEVQAEEVSTAVTTEVVTENPIAESYNQEYNGIKIKNETSYELTNEILNTNNLNINSENIIIFHTHTCESYTQSENYQYTPTGNYRTTDLNYSVARVRRRTY